MAAPALCGPLSTRGAKICRADGTPVKIASVALSGFPLHFEQWVKGHTLPTVLDAVKQMGFNCIRLAISTQLFTDRTLFDQNGGEIRNNIRVNHPDLADKTPIELLDFFVAEAGKRGLGITLDLHKNRHGDFQSELWFQTANPDDPSDTGFVGFNDPQNRWTDKTNEATFVKLWEALAQRYTGNTTILGYDLFNEPHGRATWGDGGPTDWRRAAERVGGAIQQIDPTKLLIVEGIGPDTGPIPPGHQPVPAAFWGENLNRAGEFPVRLSNVVYSPHDYGPSVSGQFWLCPTINPTAMREVWERLWGYLARNDVAPIWVGEFGQPSLAADVPGGQQVRQLLDYMHEIGAHFDYWVLHDGASGDTGGLILAASNSLGDPAVISEKVEVLSHYLTPVDASFGNRKGACLNGFVPNYQPYDTTQQSSFPPVPCVPRMVPVSRPAVVKGPEPVCAA
jgi:endoglucanase